MSKTIMVSKYNRVKYIHGDCTFGQLLRVFSTHVPTPMALNDGAGFDPQLLWFQVVEGAQSEINGYEYITMKVLKSTCH